MKTISCIVLSLLSVVAVSRAESADSPNRPPGVSVREWIPVADGFGIVIAANNTQANRPLTNIPGDALNVPEPAMNIPRDTRVLALTPPVGGYFMVRTAGGLWARLVVLDPIKGPGAAG